MNQSHSPAEKSRFGGFFHARRAGEEVERRCPPDLYSNLAGEITHLHKVDDGTHAFPQKAVRIDADAMNNQCQNIACAEAGEETVAEVRFAHGSAELGLRNWNAIFADVEIQRYLCCEVELEVDEVDAGGVYLYGVAKGGEAMLHHIVVHRDVCTEVVDWNHSFRSVAGGEVGGKEAASGACCACAAGVSSCSDDACWARAAGVSGQACAPGSSRCTDDSGNAGSSRCACGSRRTCSTRNALATTGTAAVRAAGIKARMTHNRISVLSNVSCGMKTIKLSNQSM